MQPDPCAEPTAGQLTLTAALERILDDIQPTEKREQVAISNACGRVLAEAIRSPMDLPAFANSAMDGYALRAGSVEPNQRLRVVGTSAAGHPYMGTIGTGECVRIFTGSVLPAETDAVVIQEQVQRDGNRIHIFKPVTPGENVRQRGEEIRIGDPLLPAGKTLAPADLGLLASIGQVEVTVGQQPRIALLSTGDELRPIGQPLGPGEIYDSNRYVLTALAAELGAKVLDFGTVPDDPHQLREVIREAARSSDAIISSGGASVGEADFVVKILGELGRVDFWKVAVKPGKPFAFGRIGASYFFGLPGNPVAAIVSFRQLVRPALLRLMGATSLVPLRLQAICENRLRKPPGRVEFQRGIFRRTPAGGLSVQGLTDQGSHRLTSVSRANCFIVLPLESSGVEPGQPVEIEPFDT